MLVHSTSGGTTCHDNPYQEDLNKAIRVVVECPDESKPAVINSVFRGNGNDNKEEAIEAAATETESAEGKRCATTLLPRSLTGEGAPKDLPYVTYTFWECGFGDKGGCTCGISRVVGPVPHDQAVAIGIGEYLSEGACNAQCARGPDDKCWDCVATQSWPPGPTYTTYQCMHKTDSPGQYLNQPGKTLAQCNYLGACPKLTALPYELAFE